jgi:hypothetical protein
MAPIQTRHEDQRLEISKIINSLYAIIATVAAGYKKHS